MLLAAILTADELPFTVSCRGGLELRQSVGGRLIHGPTEFSPLADANAAALPATLEMDGAAIATVDGWDSATVADGWHLLKAKEGGSVAQVELLALNHPAIVIHGGVIEESCQWGSDQVHILQHWVRIPAGVRLEIAPGSVVKCCPLVGFQVEGELVAHGVRFTSITDSRNGGDTYQRRDDLESWGELCPMVGSGQVYVDSSYLCRRLKVQGANGEGGYLPGERVSLEAPATSGRGYFLNWQGEGIVLDNPSLPQQSFHMPAYDVTLQAWYGCKVLLPLQQGWNLLALPGRPTAQGLAALKALPMVMPLKGSNSPLDILPGEGWWGYSPENATLEVEVLMDESTAITLQPGWNCVGATFLQRRLNGKKYGVWQPAKNGWQRLATSASGDYELEEGRGYYVFCP